MRISTASVIVAALTFGTPAWVQAQGAQPKAPPQAQSDDSGDASAIRSVQVVDVKDLEPEMRSKVEAVVAQAGPDDLQDLRKAVEASPEAVTALKAKGLSSSQVVAVNLSNGVLTLFAKTA